MNLTRTGFNKVKSAGVFALLITVFISWAKAQTPADPTISVSGLSTAQQTASVTLTESTSGATIHYTTDGSIPTTSSPSISSGSSILISQNATLQAQAFLSSSSTSSIITEKIACLGMVSAGTSHTLFLKNDGTVWASGDNSAGELGNGDGTGSSQSSPVQVEVSNSVPLEGIVAVAAGNTESFAIDASGNVWAWGLNTNGQLGLGTNDNAYYASQISALGNMVAISASQYHVLALRADGSTWGWGANTSGQGGNGTTSSWITTPTQVIAPSGQAGYLQGIAAVAAGANHSLALGNNGEVWAWGCNSAGQLGNADSTLTSQSVPVQVLRSGIALTNVVALAAGSVNSFAVRKDGTVLSWGDNTIGELGNGITSPASPITLANLSAAPVAGLDETMVAIGSQSAFGTDGTPWTWGDNTSGQLGIDYIGYYATLPLAVNLSSAASPTLAVTAGNGQTVNDGAFSAPLTISATSGGSSVANAWVNLIVGLNGGLLGLTSGATQLSPIIGARTNSSGQVSFYLQGAANGSGTITLTATSGSSQTMFSVIEAAAQAMATDTPTMPQWGLIVMTALLIWTAARKKKRLEG